MTLRFSLSCDHSCVKMADHFANNQKKTRSSNDKTIIELGYRKISLFVSGEQINYLPQPSARQIIDLLTTDKSLYLAQLRPIIVKCPFLTIKQRKQQTRKKKTVLISVHYDMFQDSTSGLKFNILYIVITNV